MPKKKPELRVTHLASGDLKLDGPIDQMIRATVSCTICGVAGYGKCDCWTKCSDCGWMFEKGTQCRNCAYNRSI
jgi:hypothetical protein